MKSDSQSYSEKVNQSRLYGIVDLGYTAESDLISTAQSLISGGADILQIRAKGHTPAQVEKYAIEILPYCQRAEIPLIINDFAEVASVVGADGVHIGQDDGSLEMVRRIVGDSMIVGRSTHSKEQAEVALEEGFDYIGFGPLFPTPTKKGRPAIGMDDLFYVEKKVGVEIPVFCIGGITRANIDEVIQAGASRVVIVSDLLTASSIESATSEAKSKLL